VPDTAEGKLDVGSAVGERGFFHVIKDMGLKEPYVGSVSLFSGEIGNDLAMYFLESEQIPAAVGLGVRIDTDLSVLGAGGYIVQAMPDAGRELIDVVERNVLKMPSVSSLIKEKDGCVGILTYLMQGIKYIVLDKYPIKFGCNCSHDRFREAISLLGVEELKNLRHEDKEVEVICQFCRRRYTFSQDELAGMIKAATLGQ